MRCDFLLGPVSLDQEGHQTWIAKDGSSSIVTMNIPETRISSFAPLANLEHLVANLVVESAYLMIPAILTRADTSSSSSSPTPLHPHPTYYLVATRPLRIHLTIKCEYESALQLTETKSSSNNDWRPRP